MCSFILFSKENTIQWANVAVNRGVLRGHGKCPTRRSHLLDSAGKTSRTHRWRRPLPPMTCEGRNPKQARVLLLRVHLVAAGSAFGHADTG